MTRAYRVLLFDLFGTVAQFVTPPPGRARAGFEWLRDAFAAHRPAVPFEDFQRALMAVSSALAAERTREHREVPSRERFRRALDVLAGDAGDDAARHAESAEALSLTHMAYLAAQTVVPAEHVALLRELAGDYRLGLVSNFDHAPTAQAILARDGVLELFEAVLISDDFGRRKPHPEIFSAALQRMHAVAADALFIGDSLADDIVGAQAAGLDVAWINRHGEAAPDPPPTYTLHQLVDLRSVLGAGK